MLSLTAIKLSPTNQGMPSLTAENIALILCNILVQCNSFQLTIKCSLYIKKDHRINMLSLDLAAIKLPPKNKGKPSLTATGLQCVKLNFVVS